MTDRQRFESYQRRWRDAHAREGSYEREVLLRYGKLRPPQAWLTKGEQAKLDVFERAADKAMEAMFVLLDRVSPRRWDSGVAAWWVMEKLTWDDATTAGPLTVTPQRGYGTTERQIEAFARAQAGFVQREGAVI